MLTNPTLEFVDYILIPKNVDFKVNKVNIFQMLTGQLFLARPSVAQMSNDKHFLLGISGAAGVLAVAQQV